jgi:Cof subfamily protein (haloacid dehalogenase superfamily)
MVRANLTRQCKLAAIDLDGTLLGYDGQISPANRRAVQRLQNAGLEVVLASGRHYVNMRRYAETLGIQWLVSSQGGELSNLNRTVVLTADFLPAARVTEISDLGAARGFTTLGYGIDGVFTTSSWGAELDFYSQFTSYRPLDCSPAEFAGRQFFKLIWMGAAHDLDQAVQLNLVDTAQVQVVRTHAKFLEFMPVGVTKASALMLLAARLGVKPAEAITFGDGDNDVPMLEWAGLSVAMAHGWPAARQKATYTSPSGSVDSALARAVDLVFDKKHILDVGMIPNLVTVPQVA